MNKVLYLLFLVGLITACSKGPRYKDASLPIDKRVSDLLKRMTPEEKFFQLFMIPFDGDSIKQAEYKNGMFGFQVSANSSTATGANGILNYSASEDRAVMVKKINRIQRHFIEETRLGIPVIFFDEALHGLVRRGATAFPQSIALAATFDTAMMTKVAKAIAVETKSRGIRQVLSPVVNIASDVRWGRTEETYGEDPFLISSMSVAYVKQFEKLGIVTTPKHFVANVGDGGRDSYPIHLNERYLEEYHFPSFRACIEDGGSRSIMTSYNSLNGKPDSQNDWLLRKKLKGDWQFSGFVVSDANAVGGANVLHMTAPDYAQSGALAIENGLDVIFQTSYHHYGLYIPPFLDGTIAQKYIDEAVSRVLKAKFELGLFDDPYVDEKEVYDPSLHKAIAERAALESLVLLKNERKTLPISSEVNTLAVIGKDAVEARLGGYSGPGNDKITLLSAMDSLFGNVLYAEGCGRRSYEPEVIESKFLSNSDSMPGLKAEYFNNLTFEGKPILTRNDERIDFSWTLYPPDSKLGNHFYSVRWLGSLRAPRTGVYEIGLESNDGFRLFINDSLVVDRWRKESFHQAMTPFRFVENKQYKIRVEFYESVGNARIRLLWNLKPDESSEKIKAAVEVARKSDVAVVVAGIEEGEFRDRASLALPGRQEEMIAAVASTGVPTVVVLIGGSAVTMTKWIDKVDAVLVGWYPGEAGGMAIAKTLLGRYNPAGRLPITFPLDEGQLPLVYNHEPTGRGDDYDNMTGRPLFPFGFGLSYTTFNYSKLKVDKLNTNKDDVASVTFELQNTGELDGDEVVQLYIRDVESSVVRPVMELKSFQRVHLKAGERKVITFTITSEMLSMINSELERIVEPGKFRIMIGASSNDIRLAYDIIVPGQK